MRPWESAVKRAMLADNGKKLRAIADKLAEMAADGDIQAIKEIGDRLDGKPKQAIVGGDEGDQPLIVRIERIIVDNAAKE